jgi:hypothetical protein
VADVEEEKPEPDLDELLEQFREPEEKPRRKAVPGSAWLMMALLLGLGGVWLAFLVVTGGPVEKTLGPPLLPTKVSDRTPREEQAGDVVEDYIARCEKGMTAQEVRWIVEDFQREGLDEGPGSFRAIIETTLKHLDLAAATWQELEEVSIDAETSATLKTLGLEWALRQQRWYAGALADGLRLSPEQKLRLKASGRRFVSEREEDFLHFRDAAVDAQMGPFEPGTNYFQKYSLGGLSPNGTDLLFPRTGLLDASHWLSRPDAAPSERIELTVGQLEIVRLQEEHDVEIPSRLRGIEDVFPLVTGQKVPTDYDDIVGLAEALHPAQLKLLLLIEPETAGELAEALEKSNE